MKKTLIILAIGLFACFSTQAQITHKGARLGLGASYVADDQLTSSPVLGVTLGGFINYGFENAQSFWADNLYLQAGFNIARRGTNFEQVLEGTRSYRYGYSHNYYAQIPIMACWRYELPLLQPNHIVNFYVGPVISVGMFGKYRDRQVTPGYPQTTVNYDTELSSNRKDRYSFQHMRRIDAALQLGVGYQHNNITLDLFWEHGFVPLMNSADVLRTLSNNQLTPGENGSTPKPDNRNAYTGTNSAFMLSVSYQLPWGF